MKFVAFITDYAAVDRIIDHLKLTFVAVPLFLTSTGSREYPFLRGKERDTIPDSIFL